MLFTYLCLADVDLRLGNVDLKKLSKDIDAIINKESRKSDVEDGLTKDYQPDSKSVSFGRI